jgi:hypothetical protein
MDPAMAGAPPMAPPPMDPAAAGGDPAAAGKPKKVDPAVIDAKLWQVMKLLTTLMNHMDIAIPADVLLGPPPDAGALAAATQSSQGMDAQSQAGAAGIDGGGGDPAAGGDPSAIAPIEPVQGAAPKMAADAGLRVGQEVTVDDLLKMAEAGQSLLGDTEPTEATQGAEALAAMARQMNRDARDAS